MSGEDDRRGRPPESGQGATREIELPDMSAILLRRSRTSPGQTVPAAPSPFHGARQPTTQPAGRLPRPPVGPEAPVIGGDQWARDRERRREVARLSRSFLIHLDTLARNLVVHDPSNAAVRQLLEALQIDLVALHAMEGDIAIVFAEGHAFVNGVWVRATQRAYEAAQLLTAGLADLEGRGFVLQKDIASLQGLVGLARLLRVDRRSQSDEARRSAVRDLPGVRLVPLSRADEGRLGSATARENAVKVLREGIETLSRTELANLDLYMRRRQRALVRNLVQLAEDTPEELLEITAIRDATMPPSAHNLMVAIYAVAIGRSMDLGRRDLMRLGVAALNHNLGEGAVQGALFALPRKLTASERLEVEQHPLLGLEHLLTHYGYGAATVARALVSAEHHVHWDGSGGYPFASFEPRHLFSRIVACCDAFDALCAARPQRPAYPPDQAVKLVLRWAGRQLDPLIARALVRLVGKYPPGSLVELDSGEWAIVVGPGRGATPLERPRVLLIADEDGFEHPTPMLVDLGERSPRRRAWLRTIVRARDAAGMNVRVARYLLADRLEVPPVLLDHGVEREGA